MSPFQGASAYSTGGVKGENEGRANITVMDPSLMPRALSVPAERCVQVHLVYKVVGTLHPPLCVHPVLQCYWCVLCQGLRSGLSSMHDVCSKVSLCNAVWQAEWQHTAAAGHAGITASSSSKQLGQLLCYSGRRGTTALCVCITAARRRGASECNRRAGASRRALRIALCMHRTGQDRTSQHARSTPGWNSHWLEHTGWNTLAHTGWNSHLVGHRYAATQVRSLTCLHTGQYSS